MNPAQLERLREQLTRLRLLKSRDRLDALLQEAAGKDLSYAEFLDQVLGEEVAAKDEKNITMRTSLARFPFVKSLDAFDFSYRPSLDKKQIQQVATSHFIEAEAYTIPRLLIIDDIGSLPMDRIGANLFFSLISRRDEKGR